MTNARKADLWMLLTVTALLLVAGCATVGQFPPGGRICRPDTDATEDCNCEVFVVPTGWKHRDCPPSPTPSPSITPTPQPTPTSTPTPVPTPTPTPPPTPGPQPTPGACPALAGIAVALHAAQTPTHHLSCQEGVDTDPCTPKPVVGGWVVLDDTPLFESNDASGRCNGEKHWRCTTLKRAHETEDPEHLESIAQQRECRSFRRCEMPAGPCWTQTDGPTVEFHAQNPGDGGRGYQIIIGPFTQSGEYTFHSWAGTAGCPWRDEEGKPVSGEAHGERTFRVN